MAAAFVVEVRRRLNIAQQSVHSLSARSRSVHKGVVPLLAPFVAEPSEDRFRGQTDIRGLRFLTALERMPPPTSAATGLVVVTLTMRSLKPVAGS